VIRWAGIYDFFVNHIFGRRSQKMRVEGLKHAELKPGSRILDFGCGAGDLAFEAERIIGGQGKIIGIDPSAEMVKVAERKAAARKSKVAFKNQAVEKLSFADGSFDVVTSSFVLHHLPEDLQAKAFKELKRVLKPGGLFFAIDMTSEATFSHKLHRHMQGGSGTHEEGLHQAASRLENAGFKNVTVGKSAKGVGYLRGFAA
jgi:ubiquinone/menaquinone biosynthesis C-methylase UbiE